MENEELFDRTLKAISEADRYGFDNTRDALIEVAFDLVGQDALGGVDIVGLLKKHDLSIPA